MKQTLLLLFLLNALCAQAQQTIYYSIPEAKTFTNTFINHKEINPAQFDDTALVSIDAFRERTWIGDVNSFEGLVVSAEVNPSRSKSSFGAKAEFFGFEQGIITNQSYELFYKYRLFQGDQFRVFAGAGLGFMQVKYIFLSEVDVSEAGFNSVTSSIGAFAAYWNHRLGISYSDFLPYTEFIDGEGNKMNNMLGRFTVNYAYLFKINKTIALIPELLYFHTSNDDLFMLNALLQIKRAFRTGLFVQSDKEFGGIVAFTIAGVAELGYAISFKRIDDRDQLNGTHVIKLGFNIPGQ